MTLDPTIHQLAQGKNFAALTVHLPSGAAATQIMWIDADDDHVIFNTEVHRAKFRAIEADPRVTVAIWDAANPYHYGEVRGRVARIERGADARSHIDELSRKYTGGDYANPITSERVKVFVEPERQRVQ